VLQMARLTVSSRCAKWQARVQKGAFVLSHSGVVTKRLWSVRDGTERRRPVDKASNSWSNSTSGMGLLPSTLGFLKKSSNKPQDLPLSDISPLPEVRSQCQLSQYPAGRTVKDSLWVPTGKSVAAMVPEVLVSKVPPEKREALKGSEVALSEVRCRWKN